MAGIYAQYLHQQTSRVHLPFENHTSMLYHKLVSETPLKNNFPCILMLVRTSIELERRGPVYLAA